MTQQTFEILVIYGSQTGNSEAAAKELGSAIEEKVSISSNVKVTTSVMQCDDFLELQKAQWKTRLFVIITSSYGVGHAPIGCAKFRSCCDEILDSTIDYNNILEGMHYALLGLGDSFYSTFFHNPTRIHDALTKAGANRVGELGKADASGKGENDQQKVIQRWMDDIIPVLATQVKTILQDDEEKTNDILAQATKNTEQVCSRIFDDWNITTNTSSFSLFLPIIILITAIIAGLFCLK